MRLNSVPADDVAEEYEKDETLKEKSDKLKETALHDGKELSLGPGIAYAEAPGWTDRRYQYLDENLVGYVRTSRLHARDNVLPDPDEEK
ncbi:hypothetical protein [Streptomyces sp. NPDC017868]|uniref:hypothetical protein n=1 Tax=Streptomyces sp. NPDC017868 TaxID=3365014 RepID=UPI00379E31BA